MSEGNGYPQPTESKVNAQMLKAWRERAELLLEECNECGQIIYYPRGFCPNCWSTNLKMRLSSGKGKIQTFSIVHRGPDAAFDAEVIVLAEVKMEEGVSLISRIICDDPTSVQMGQAVTLLQKPKSDQYPLPVFSNKA